MNKEVDFERSWVVLQRQQRPQSIPGRAIIPCRHDQREGSDGKSAVFRENRVDPADSGDPSRILHPHRDLSETHRIHLNLVFVCASCVLSYFVYFAKALVFRVNLLGKKARMLKLSLDQSLHDIG